MHIINARARIRQTCPAHLVPCLLVSNRSYLNTIINPFSIYCNSVTNLSIYAYIYHYISIYIHHTWERGPCRCRWCRSWPLRRSWPWDRGASTLPRRPGWSPSRRTRCTLNTTNILYMFYHSIYRVNVLLSCQFLMRNIFKGYPFLSLTHTLTHSLNLSLALNSGCHFIYRMLRICSSVWPPDTWLGWNVH